MMKPVMARIVMERTLIQWKNRTGSSQTYTRLNFRVSMASNFLDFAARNVLYLRNMLAMLVIQMDGTGYAGVKGMNGPNDFQR